MLSAIVNTTDVIRLIIFITFLMITAKVIIDIPIIENLRRRVKRLEQRSDDRHRHDSNRTGSRDELSSGSADPLHSNTEQQKKEG